MKPGLLITYHRSNTGEGSLASDQEDVLVAEIQQTYDGKVVAARDLDIY